MKELFGAMDEKYIEMFMNIEGFDKALNQMAQPWKKLWGEHFIFDYLQQQGDDFIRGITKFEAKIDEAMNSIADVVVGKGNKLLEFKHWSRSAITNFLGSKQTLSQLKAYFKSGQDFEYIFSKNKLLKEGVADPEKFVKGEFQKMFQKNAKELFESNEELFKKMKFTDGKPVKDWQDFQRLISDNEAFDTLISSKYIIVN